MKGRKRQSASISAAKGNPGKPALFRQAYPSACRIVDWIHVSDLPASWWTLYELTRRPCRGSPSRRGDFPRRTFGHVLEIIGFRTTADAADAADDPIY